jgi:hypothetical protein
MEPYRIQKGLDDPSKPILKPESPYEHPREIVSPVSACLESFDETIRKKR